MARFIRGVGRTYHHALEVDLSKTLVRLVRRATNRLGLVPVSTDDGTEVSLHSRSGELVLVQGVGDVLLAVGTLDLDLGGAGEGRDGAVLGPIPIGQTESLGGLGVGGIIVLLGDLNGVVHQSLLYFVSMMING